MSNSKSSITDKIARKFSFCAYLLPSKKTRMFYQKGSKHLHEYLDIRKIIKRLQDLDKLKMVLLSDEQRRLFEYIPKPDVLDANNKFSLESITKYKKKAKDRKISKNFPHTMKTMIEDNDPVNKRILDCLDLKFKNNDESDRISIFRWIFLYGKYF